MPARQVPAQDNDTTRERLLLLPVIGIFSLCALVLLLAICGTDADKASAPRHETEELMMSKFESAAVKAKVTTSASFSTLPTVD